MVKLSEIENAFRDRDVEITVHADSVHVQMLYTPGEKGKAEWRVNNGISKGLGGNWISKDKNGAPLKADSHWHIPSEREAPSKTLGEISREQEKSVPDKWREGLKIRLDGIISELQRLRQEIGS